MPQSQKTWWAPVWRGLVVDPEGKHYRRLKGALWLLLYLILHADRRTGVVQVKLQTVAHMTGISRRTLQWWLYRLRVGGYVSVEGTGRAVRVGIRRWKTLTRTANPAPLGHRILPIRGARNGRARPWE